MITVRKQPRGNICVVGRFCLTWWCCGGNINMSAKGTIATVSENSLDLKIGSFASDFRGAMVLPKENIIGTS